MPEGESRPEGKKRRFNQEQCDMLMRCSEKRDMAEWNEWLEANGGVKIELEGADLSDTHLVGAQLLGAHLEGADLHRAHLEGSCLSHSHLEGATLRWAHLEGAVIEEAHLEGADLSHARLVGATVWGAHLQGAQLFDAHLEGATSMNAHLEKANLDQAYLQGADLLEAHLEGAILGGAHLEGVAAGYAAVDGSTLLVGCSFDRDTNFTGVALANTTIDPGLRAALEANVRRMRWGEWCAEKPWRRRPWKLFWFISDYGQSARRILLAFFILSFLFALVYWCCPTLVSGLEGADGVRLLPAEVRLRAFYFSVVTMTTLGFGDMHAHVGSPCGHFILGVQVCLGYVLLGALITRLGILYQSLGPQQDPTPPRKNTDGTPRT
ncbi:MAG: pentapeptide repeat-containing protein [Planctomycetota bacterium]|jgi:uncharacterized protein YjbI with pentapeptide repeats